MKKSIVRVLALVLMLTLVITSSAAALKLQKNDKSDNVRRLQQALTQLGYYLFPNSTEPSACTANFHSGIVWRSSTCNKCVIVLYNCVIF